MTNDYDKFAKARQEQLKKGGKWPHRFIEKPMMRGLLPDLTGKKVLMVGCGTGEEALMLQEFGAAEIVGIDLSEESIRLAKESYPEFEFVSGDMHKLPFEDASFDFIYSSLAVHYSATPEDVYREMYRVLKDGGRMLVSIGHPLRWACDELEVEGGKYRVIGHSKEDGNGKVLGNYNTFSKRAHYFPNGEVLEFYVGSPSYQFKTIKKAGFTVEDFSEGICTEEAKDFDLSYYQKFHEIPQFMAFLARK